MTTTNWRLQARCRDRDSKLFMPKIAAKENCGKARAVCAACPVTDECLTAALQEERGLTYHFRATVRGGLTPRERADLDKNQKEAA
ncbi:WhiB family transcriptional regulator [Streptomyces syringium]|uniref:WhiB family transcriptional regulator n=1 Tax=Streptomyces syringium TaxID=76729 RepID=UPI0037D7CB8D